MNIEMPYGSESMNVELPEGTVRIPNVAVTQLEPVKDLRATVQAALASPSGLPPLGELVKSSSKVTIAFDDATVSSFSPVRGIVIKEVMAELEKAGVIRENVMLICGLKLKRCSWTTLISTLK